MGEKKRLPLLAALILLALLFLAPMALTIAGSLMSSDEIAAHYGPVLADDGYMTEPVELRFLPDRPTAEQYENLVREPAYWQKYTNSVLYTVPTTLLQTAVAALAAYGFASRPGRGRRLLLLGYALLALMPYQVTLVPNYFVSKWLGLYDTRWAILLPGVFSTFGVFLLTKYMARVPKETMEAARLDGAGEWRVFLHICLPQCKSALWAAAMLTFFDNWSMMEQPLILLRGEELYPLSVWLSRLNGEQPGLAFAAAVVYLLPCLLIFALGQRNLGEGLK